MTTDNNPIETPEQEMAPEASKAVETPKKRVSRTRKKAADSAKESAKDAVKEGKTRGRKRTEKKVSEKKAEKMTTLEDKPTETVAPEMTTADVQTGNVQAGNMQATDAQTAENLPAEKVAAVEQASESVAANVQTSENQPAVEPALDIKPAETTASDNKPAETTAEEEKTTEAAEAENKPAEPSVTQEPLPEKRQERRQDRRPERRNDKRPERKRSMPVIKDFCDLSNYGGRIPMLNEQQIQQLTYEDAEERFNVLEGILSTVLNYDIVLSDTNIWLELLIGHTSSHSDPRVNARLQFERQLEFLSKMMKRIGGKFMMMSETYEEIDRFASQQEPTNYKDADWNDEVLCRNVAARLAKRLILSQQKENRLRIEGIGSESHHAAFADPAIIRRTVEFFSQGKKVLLLTNDASVGIRSLGMCDDLQRTNNIDDKTWSSVYEPQRPMVLNMDDLKLLDNYTRQYHFLMLAANRQWMQEVPMREAITLDNPLKLWMEGFRAGDRHERRSDRIEQQRKEEREKREKAERERQEREKQEKAEREKREKAEREKQEKAKREKAEQQRKARQNRSEQPVAEEAAEAPAVVEAEKVETPVVEAVAQQEVTTEEPAAETAEVAGSFGDTTEMMDLITPQDSERKPRSNRSGGRRRGGSRRRPSNKPAGTPAE